MNTNRTDFDPQLARRLERLYHRYNAKDCMYPDPVCFPHRYADPADRELAALVAASLAYGRVAHIYNSVTRVLDVLGPNPARRLRESGPERIRRDLCGFVHRFCTDGDMEGLLSAVARVLEAYGSLEEAFVTGLYPGERSLHPPLCRFVEVLEDAGAPVGRHLVPRPERGSAVKRLCLFLRWMVRADNVDPGGWTRVPPSLLVVPLDTHMHRIATRMGFTSRKAADFSCAVEITRRFARIRPDDPVRYDFALTRVGMSGEDLDKILGL
ncbi:MAG: TIGR02757 family protein [Desulfatibacillaceae bacterium]